MLNIKFIFNFLGRLLMMEGLFLIIPLFVSLLYQDGEYMAFLYSIILTFLAGLTVWVPFRNCSRSIRKGEGFLLVSIVWISYSIFGSLPYLFSSFHFSFTDAFFETLSGFTTTGASVIPDVEILPKSLLFWRSFTHFIGGMGILVLTLTVMPMLGTGAVHLYSAETSGPTMSKFTPRIKEAARTLWVIYTGLIVLETILLLAGGMSFFDSLCHSFGTVATGGFSTRNDSIAGFSPYIQYVIAFFMLLSGVNFTLYYFLLAGKFRKFFRNQELHLFLGIILIAIAFVSLSLILNDSYQHEKAIRSAFFQVTSIVTSTGFATDDYMQWSNQLWVVLFFLMFTGGSAGSTSGGIKMVRHLLMLKNIRMMLHKLVHPIGWIYPVRLNKNVVSNDVIVKVFAFFMIYFGSWALGTLVLTISGVDLISASGASAGTLGGIGPGLGELGPAGNYSQVPFLGKWTLSFLMLLGRLELFAILVLFTAGFWKNK